ncbi:MAG: chromate resistance protein ChrB domain-containing protein [Pseudomonadota bacterium]
MDTITHPISVSALASQLGSTLQPLILDVRRHAAFAADPCMIAGATWRDPFTISNWLKFLSQDREIVVYCVHGHEISQNVCTALRAAGLTAFFLEGGIEAWKTFGGMTIKKNPVVSVPSAVNAPSRWITRERPKIDRIACPWLIRCFIDPCAEFYYAPANDVLREAAEINAIPYDVPGVTFTHRGAYAERCSFDAFIEDFALQDDALNNLAAIVRGADTGKLELTPQSPGLLAISLGLSTLYRNDHDMLGHGITVYGALYAWLKAARLEIHNADLFKAKS